jgi:hypothetical protein
MKDNLSFFNMEGTITKSTDPVAYLSDGIQTQELDYERQKGYVYGFWAYVTAYMLINSIAAIANAFLLFVTYGERNSGRLSYLDNAIKSLAVTDMLFGLIGAPLRVRAEYFGYGKLVYSIKKKIIY